MNLGRVAGAWIGVLLLLGALIAGPAVDATTVADGPTIEEVTFPDGSVADRADGRVYVWRSALDSLTVQVGLGTASSRVRLCVEASDPSNGTTGRITCREQLVSERNSSVRLPLGGWAANQSGHRRLGITLRNAEDRSVLDARELSVVVVVRGGDLDGDGLTDAAEFENGTNVDRRDTDADGLLDGTEVKEYGTDPLSNDTDGDGLRDAQEIGGGTNATDPDTDGDGLADGAEVTDYDSNPTAVDTDGDGLTDREEVLEYGTDPALADTDGDGLSDRAEVTEYGTDPTVADTDGDGLADSEEISEYGTDPTVADTDGDGLPDGVEVTEYGTDPALADTDGDGLTDREEVLEYGTDPTVADTDGDLLDDALEVSLGTGPTSGLTTPAVLVGLAVVVIGASVALRGRIALALGDGDVTGTSGGDVEDTGDGIGKRDGDTVAGDTAGTAPTDSLPLPDEDRVKRLLRENDGRLQQGEFVERTEWSKSKVSRLLSRMEEEGEVEKIALGRQNLVVLTDGEPEDESDGESGSSEN